MIYYRKTKAYISYIKRPKDRFVISYYPDDNIILGDPIPMNVQMARDAQKHIATIEQVRDLSLLYLTPMR